MEQQGKRIGVFGGTFDPIHVGHVQAAQAAAASLSLDEMILVPNRQSPLRMGEDRTSTEDRMEMTRLAIRDLPGWSVSGIEAERDGPSYLVETLEAFRSDHPDATLVFLMGFDSLSTFDRWVRVEEIVNLAEVWVMPRPGKDGPQALAALEARAPALQGTVKLLEGPMNDISATGIREAVRAGEAIDHLVPPAVADYIKTRKLYL